MVTKLKPAKVNDLLSSEDSKKKRKADETNKMKEVSTEHVKEKVCDSTTW